MNEKTLKEMIREQQRIVEGAQSQLNKLYNMAQELGIAVDRSEGIVYDSQSSTKNYIEEQRKQIMQRVDSLRERAISQAQKVLSGTQSMKADMNVPQMPNIMGSVAVMPDLLDTPSEPNLEDIKEKFEEVLKLHKGELPQEAIDTMRKKLDGEKDE